MCVLVDMYSEIVQTKQGWTISIKFPAILIKYIFLP